MQNNGREIAGTRKQQGPLLKTHYKPKLVKTQEMPALHHSKNFLLLRLQPLSSPNTILGGIASWQTLASGSVLQGELAKFRS